MNTFPVVSSILSAAHIAVFLQQQYGWVEMPVCRIIKAGVNHTYSVSVGNTKYVFRVYSRGWRNREEIAEELRLITHLHQNSIPVSIPVADNKGECLQLINAPEGTRYGVLFSYADGEKLYNFSIDTHYQTGVVIASLHRHTQHFLIERMDYNSKTLLIDSFEELKQFISTTTEEMVFMQSAQQYLLQLLDTVDEAALRKGAVHLDIWFDNMNVDSDGNITIFDFDFCGNGWLCLDIAYYLMQLSVVEPIEEEYQKKTAAFLAGYESVIPITDEEKRLLPALGLCLHFFYLGVQCQRFDDWSNVFISETYLKRYIIARVKRHFDFHQLGNAVF